jgi:hypothetical protein
MSAAPAYSRAHVVAKRLGISRSAFYKSLYPRLTAYEVAGVVVFSDAEVEALVEKRSTPSRCIERNGVVR